MTGVGLVGGATAHRDILGTLRGFGTLAAIEETGHYLRRWRCAQRDSNP